MEPYELEMAVDNNYVDCVETVTNDSIKKYCRVNAGPGWNEEDIDYVTRIVTSKYRKIVDSYMTKDYVAMEYDDSLEHHILKGIVDHWAGAIGVGIATDRNISVYYS